MTDEASEFSTRPATATPEPGSSPTPNKPAGSRYCAQPVAVPRALPPGTDPRRSRAIIGGSTKWLNGTVLHYYFFDHDVDGCDRAWTVPQNQRQVVRTAFTSWKDLGLGLEFREVVAASEAEVRIGFDTTDGSWSYVGKDILQQPQTDRTMNFGWDLTANAYGTTTALHEIGHTLGMPHEHQNPFAGIVWNEEAVYAELGGPPNNWDRQTTFNNILRKITPAEVVGSNWDPDSIMEYAFGDGLIRSPAAYTHGVNPPGILSPLDEQYMVSWYPGQGPVDPQKPPALSPFVTVPAQLAPGQQVDFTLDVAETRVYTIATFGQSDTMLGLFERVGADLRFVAGDDDAGEDRNALIKHRLFKGREYVVRLRCYYAQRSATTALMYW